MEDEYLQLRTFGLSKLAIACYKSLSENGYTHIGPLAKRLGKTPNGLHRVLATLTQKGFIKVYIYETGWRYYVAEPLYQVIVNHQAEQRLQLNKLIRLQEEHEQCKRRQDLHRRTCL